MTRERSVIERIRRPADLTAEVLRVTRFAATGVVGFSVNVGTFAVLLRLAHLDYRLAAVGANVAGYLTSFVLSREWIFRGHDSVLQHQLWRFAVVATCSAGLAIGTAIVLVDSVGLTPHVGEAAAAIAVAPISFLAHRVWTFARRPAPTPSSESPGTGSSLRGRRRKAEPRDVV